MNREPNTRYRARKSMKFSKQITRCAAILALAVSSPFGLRAAEPTRVVEQRSFASPAEAISALKEAHAAKDKAALLAVFGPEFDKLLTGDPVQDANNARKFEAALAEGVRAVNESDGKIVLEVGANGWPMPIPLIQTGGQWHFDTSAGRDEIVNRHIGRAELHAIGVCRAYVAAQRQYAEMTRNTGAEACYARKFKSSPGKKDGLYWPVAQNESASPFGPLVAEAHAEGYGGRGGGGHRPFHGYFFRILTRQGDYADGGKRDYLKGGSLTAGFALVAYPVAWDKSGIMTFVVNQDGKIFQRNLGEKTVAIAARMQEYNPDGEWPLVEADGVKAAASEK